MATGSHDSGLAPALIVWLVLDLLGLALFGVGVVFFATGQGLLGNFPGDLTGAGICSAAGAVIMLAAAAGILRQVARRASSRKDFGE